MNSIKIALSSSRIDIIVHVFKNVTGENWIYKEDRSKQEEEKKKGRGETQTIKPKHCSTHTSPSGERVTAKRMMDVNNVA